MEPGNEQLYSTHSHSVCLLMNPEMQHIHSNDDVDETEAELISVQLLMSCDAGHDSPVQVILVQPSDTSMAININNGTDKWLMDGWAL